MRTTRKTGRLTRPQPGSAGASVLLSAGPARVADEVEQCLVDLAGVGPDDRVRPACDDSGAGVLQQRGEPPAGGLVGQDAVLVAVDDQYGNLDSCEISPEVFQAGGDAADGGGGRRGQGGVEAVLPGLVADPAAAQEIDVVGVVHEVFHRGRPVGRDPRGEAVEHGPVNTVGAVIGLEQERQQRRHQYRRLDPPGAMNGQVPGDLTGAHGEPGQHHLAQVEPAEQDMKVGGERVEVVSGAGPAGGAEAAPVVGDDPVPGG